jgi:hypothetical protein
LRRSAEQRVVYGAWHRVSIPYVVRRGIVSSSLLTAWRAGRRR